MRLHFQLSPNTQPVLFDYMHFLTGAFHKWVGRNELHDGLSLYSLSWLSGGKSENGALSFPHGASWFISAQDEALLQKIGDAALRQPEVFYGMRVNEMRYQRTPEFEQYYAFKVASPVLAKSKEVEGRVQHYLYSDKEADDVLTQTLRHKLDNAGLNQYSNKTSVRFDRSYRGARTRLVTIRGIRHRASLCPVIVEGPPPSVKFAWNVGIGHLTGSGFGALR